MADMNNTDTKLPMPTSNGKAKAANANHGNISDFPAVQPPKREDLQPSYARVLFPDTEDTAAHSWYGSMINTLGSVIGTCGAVPCCVVCPNPYKPVEQGNVGLVTKYGRFARAVDPGLVKVNPLSERLIQVDVKIQIVGTPSPLPTLSLLRKGMRDDRFVANAHRSQQRSPAKSSSQKTTSP